MIKLKIKTWIGMLEFRTRFEKDPFNIKFISNSLNQGNYKFSSDNLLDLRECFDLN